MKLNLILIAVFVFTFTLISSAMAGEMTGLEIAKKWDERPTGKDLSTKADFTLINRKGQKRVRKTRRYWLDMEGEKGIDEKTIIFFDEPSDVKGTSLLNWSYIEENKDDDQWPYLPALRKIKRIASSDKEKAFMGSDLTFDDMGDRQITEDEHKRVGEEDFNGRPCHIIEMTPRENGYMYSRKLLWIDKEEFIDYKTDFYDRKGRFLKRRIVDWSRVNNIWIVKKITVNNDQTGHSTVVEMTDIQLNKGLKEQQFKKNQMESGR